MKKNSYVRPCVTAEKMEATELICASLDITSNFGGITYGGVDDEGVKEPESRRYMWEEESFEEY